MKRFTTMTFESIVVESQTWARLFFRMDNPITSALGKSCSIYRETLLP